MTPRELELDDTFAFVTRALAGRRRVLEVGAGHGELAARLAAAGHDVTAVDPHVHDAVFPVAREDFLAHQGGPYDAVLFTRSLHHIGALDAAVSRAREVLRDDGVLVLDEFDVAAPDDATARWYYEVQDLLVATGVYAPHRHGLDDELPVTRWRAEHEASPPLHPAADMLAALDLRFRIVESARVAYFYRYFCDGLADTRVAVAVRAAEQRRLDAGALVPVGVRVVAAPR